MGTRLQVCLQKICRILGGDSRCQARIQIREDHLQKNDELGVREFLRILLKSHYEICTASNGEEALKVIRERKIDSIILDLNRPRSSGIETLREIRKIDSEIPIIIITGYGTLKDEKVAREYGVIDFIPKPFNTSQIISVIDRILEKRI